MRELDDGDRKILALLQRDGRTTHKELASALGLSVTPVYTRVKRLERDGYIASYVALLDPAKVGRSLTVYCEVSLKEHSKDALARFTTQIESFPEMMECYHVTGQHDFLLKVMVENMDEYQDFIVNKLSVAPNVGHVLSSFVLGEVKRTTAYPVNGEGAG